MVLVIIVWIICVFVWIICGFVCEYMGNNKGQKNCFWYGLILGIIGIIIVACLEDKSNEIETKKVNNTNKLEDLEKLQKLKDNGTITEIEFEIEKQKLLR